MRLHQPWRRRLKRRIISTTVAAQGALVSNRIFMLGRMAAVRD
jgi:hypothetical protein